MFSLPTIETLTDRVSAAGLVEWNPAAPPRQRIAVGGNDHLRAGLLALSLLNANHQVVLVPYQDFTDALVSSCNYSVFLNTGATARIEIRSNAAVDDTFGFDWILALYTSGSTGRPRPVGFGLEKILCTTKWYTEIYGVDSNSIFITSLPATYNFAFIATFTLAARHGGTLFSGDEKAVLKYLQGAQRTGRRMVLSGNPVIIELLSDLPSTSNLLVDSGGAPLSTAALAIFRERGVDIREGYGLTETCSLTHFDREGTTESAGTVGGAMDGVHTYIDPSDTKPLISITSPNTGIVFGRSSDSGLLRTDDLGSIDSVGRLRILGRSDDARISGKWPRDTLDHVGEILGARMALVTHPSPTSVVLTMRNHMSDDLVTATISSISEFLSLPPSCINVRRSIDPLLHSVKVPRPRI